MNIFRQFIAFTLAEVLIVLGIVGIVAEMALPQLMQNVQDQAFKAAYKQAYADLSIAFRQPMQERTVPFMAVWYDPDSLQINWQILENALKVSKDCTNNVRFYTPDTAINNCWILGDRINSQAPYGPGWYSQAFIDAAGRSWASYAWNVNIFFVDTNGFKGPNKFGKDRWAFTFYNANNSLTTSGYPSKIGPYNTDDITGAATVWCNYPPCYYKTWLYQ